jgi:hypothetical protein
VSYLQTTHHGVEEGVVEDLGFHEIELQEVRSW